MTKPNNIKNLNLGLILVFSLFSLLHCAPVVTTNPNFEIEKSKIGKNNNAQLIPRSIGSVCNPMNKNILFLGTSSQDLIEKKIDELPQRTFEYDYYSAQKTGFRGIFGINLSTGLWNGLVNENGDRLGWGLFAGLQFDYDHPIFNRNSQFLVGMYSFNTSVDALNGPLNPFNALYLLQENKGSKRSAIVFTWIRGWLNFWSGEAALSGSLTFVQPANDLSARIFAAKFPQLSPEEKNKIPIKKVSPNSEFRVRLAPVFRKLYPGTFWNNYFETVLSFSAGLEWSLSSPADAYNISVNTSSAPIAKETLVAIQSSSGSLRSIPQLFFQFSLSYQNVPF